MAPPRYAGALNPPFHPSQNHMQSYHPSQQQAFLPPPGHSNSNAANSINSPYSTIAYSAFDRSTPDTLLSSQIGFARGIPNQSHQGYDGMAQVREKQEDTRIRNVWKHNLRQEMATLRALVEEYPYIAMVRIL